MSHYRHRSDANCKDIANCFEKLGCLVHRTNSTWDLTIARANVVRLIEVRAPDSDPKRRNKGNDMIDRGFPIIRVLTIDDCVDVVQGMR